MPAPIVITTTVLPGGRIEIVAPELQPGQIATVTITVPSPPVASPQRHILDIIDALPGHVLFQTAEEADAYIREERDAWE